MLRDAFECLSLSVKGEYKFQTVGGLVLLGGSLTCILAIPLILIRYISKYFLINMWLVVSISMFFAALIIMGSLISKIQRKEERIKYHTDFEKNLRCLIVEHFIKGTEEKQIIYDISHILDLQKDTSYSPNFALGVLNEKIKILRENRNR